MDKNTEKLLVSGGLILAGYLLVVKPLMNTLGIDPADQAKVDQQTNTPAADNPFSPTFQPFVDNFTQNQGGGVTIPQAMQAVYADFQAGNLQPGNALQLATWADTLKSSLGWFFAPDINAILSVFTQMSNKTQCAALAAYCAYNFNKDLLHWLYYGSSIIPAIPYGLSEAQLAIIVTEVNNLPV